MNRPVTGSRCLDPLVLLVVDMRGVRRFCPLGEPPRNRMIVPTGRDVSAALPMVVEAGFAQKELWASPRASGSTESAVEGMHSRRSNGP